MNLSRDIAGELVKKTIEDAIAPHEERNKRGTDVATELVKQTVETAMADERDSPQPSDDDGGVENVMLLREMLASDSPSNVSDDRRHKVPEETQSEVVGERNVEGSQLVAALRVPQSSTTPTVAQSTAEQRAPHSGTAPASNSRRITRSTRLNTLLIGHFSFIHNERITICGMKFNVKFKNVDEQEFRSISAPQIPYRVSRQGQSAINRIVRNGYDPRLPLIVSSDHLDNLFIVDGESRRLSILEGLDSGKLRIDKGRRSSSLYEGIRTEPAIPVIFLGNTTTTRMERLAISVALNTATRMDQPLQLGDVVVSLGSFIRGRYFTNGTEIEQSKLISMVDKITSDIMSLELLNQFMESNTEHKDIAKRWTLRNTPEDIRTEAQVSYMNKWEDCKIYVKCAVGFINCPFAYKIVFAEPSSPVVTSRFDSQWTLSLFSHKKFVSLTDDGKVLILACLALRQRTCGTPGVPFTSFEHALTLIDLLVEIYRTAFHGMNRTKLGKREIPNNVFERAILINHPDDHVRQEPYIKSIFFFMINWRPNARRFSKTAILKEVANDLVGWPSKRNWRSTEMKEISIYPDIWSVISRNMHAVKRASSGKKKSSGRSRKSTSNPNHKNDGLTQNVVKRLENDDTFDKLLDMGQRMGIEKAVKRFTKGTSKRSEDQQQAGNGDNDSPEEDGSSMDMEEPNVPLTEVVRLFRKREHKRAIKDDNNDTKAGPSNGMNGSPLEFHTALSREDVQKVSEMMKSVEETEMVCKNLPRVLPEDGIWCRSISETKVEQLRDEYRRYTVYAMKEVEGIGVPDGTDESSKELCETLLSQCYEKLCKEKLHSQGYVYFPEYFKNDSEDYIDTYMDYYDGKFDEKKIRRPWGVVKAGEEYEVKGRYYVYFDMRNFSDLVRNEKLRDAKLITEVKLGIVLDQILDDKDMKVDTLGSYPVMHGEENIGTVPIYLHETGRYSDSKRRKRYPGKPGYHLIVTGKNGFRIRLRENSKFHEHLPWENRLQLSKRFTKGMINVEPHSALLVHGSMLFNFPSSNLDQNMYERKTSGCIRMVLYDVEYDDDEGEGYAAQPTSSDSDSDPSAVVDRDEIRSLKESSSEYESSDSNDNNSSSDEASSSSSDDDVRRRRSATGRKGLHVLRKTPEALAKLRQDVTKESRGSPGSRKDSTKGKTAPAPKNMGKSIKRRNSQLQNTRKSDGNSSRGKKKPRKGT